MRLVEALSADFGSPDGVVVGRGIADLLRDVYAERGQAVPLWVRELLAHYGQEQRAP